MQIRNMSDQRDLDHESVRRVEASFAWITPLFGSWVTGGGGGDITFRLTLFSLVSTNIQSRSTAWIHMEGSNRRFREEKKNFVMIFSDRQLRQRLPPRT